MSFEIALRSRLKAGDGLNNATIEWDQRPQGRFPAIVLTLVSLPIARTMTSVGAWQQPRVQVDVFALDAPIKVALREAVLIALLTAGKVGTVRFGKALELSVRAAGEQTDTDFVHRDIIEALVPHMTEN